MKVIKNNFIFILYEKNSENFLREKLERTNSVNRKTGAKSRQGIGDIVRGNAAKSHFGHARKAVSGKR